MYSGTTLEQNCFNLEITENNNHFLGVIFEIALTKYKSKKSIERYNAKY